MWIFHLFKKLEILYNTDHEVIVNWFYEDADSLETGEDFQAIIPIPFNIFFHIGVFTVCLTAIFVVPFLNNFVA